MKKGQTNLWMILSFVLVGFLFFILGTYFPNFLKEKKDSILVPSQAVVSPTTMLIEESPAPTATQTIPQKSDLEQITEAFAKKYNKQTSEVEVTVSKNDGTHASGGVKFSGEIGGGWFLAYKGADGWIIIQDGNGVVSCETIAPYNFPKEMVSECVDKNGNLIKK